MARSKADLGGVGKASGEVPAEPIGQFLLGEVGHPRAIMEDRRPGWTGLVVARRR